MRIAGKTTEFYNMIFDELGMNGRNVVVLCQDPERTKLLYYQAAKAATRRGIHLKKRYRAFVAKSGKRLVFAPFTPKKPADWSKPYGLAFDEIDAQGWDIVFFNIKKTVEQPTGDPTIKGSIYKWAADKKAQTVEF